MGLLNGFLRGLGFEPEKKEKKEPEKAVKTENFDGAKYDLSADIFKEFVPTTQVDVQDIVDLMINGESVVVDFKNITGGEFTRALDFMTGANYALGGKVKRMSEKTFFFENKQK